MEYTITLTEDQTKVVLNAIVLHMDINGGRLISLLNVPFMQRQLSGDVELAKQHIAQISSNLVHTLRTVIEAKPVPYLDEFFTEPSGRFHLTDIQADFLISVLDTYSRLNLGQLEILLEHTYIFNRLPRIASGRFPIPDADMKQHFLENALYDLKRLIGMPRNGNNGIGHHDCPEAQQAYDILCVIRHHVRWQRAGNPPKRTAEMFGPHYDVPLHWFKPWALPEMKTVS